MWRNLHTKQNNVHAYYITSTMDTWVAWMNEGENANTHSKQYVYYRYVDRTTHGSVQCTIVLLFDLFCFRNCHTAYNTFLYILVIDMLADTMIYNIIHKLLCWCCVIVVRFCCDERRAHNIVRSLYFSLCCFRMLVQSCSHVNVYVCVCFVYFIFCMHVWFAVCICRCVHC